MRFLIIDKWTGFECIDDECIVIVLLRAVYDLSFVPFKLHLMRGGRKELVEGAMNYVSQFTIRDMHHFQVGIFVVNKLEQTNLI